MHDQQTIEQFAAIRDSLRPATIAAMINLVEGNPFALGCEPWIFDALERRGLAQKNFKQWRADDLMGMPHTCHLFDLTELGKTWLAWYRQPRDLPAQLDMFDALAQEHPQP